MGDPNVAAGVDDSQLRAFMRRILDDLEALEQMLEGGMIESGVRRIGAEQEMFLVDRAAGPAPIALQVLETLGDPAFTTELALFNLEANLPPQHFGGRCLSEMHAHLDRLVAAAREAAARHGADVLLTGILPTIALGDLSLDNMTPNPRYLSLNNTMSRLRGGAFRTMIKGLDELQVTHDNILLEACNTSFQVHFQVAPQEFARLYNLAQAVTGPVLAAAVNSPTMLQHRLWRETRVALFQQSVDGRRDVHQARGDRTRVHFGDRWVRESIIELFREDIARFRVVLSTGVEEDPLALVAQGIAPSLTALRLHNGTIYRWNRPCYGVTEGKPHLRIENRVLPSGPTTVDEVANAAFFFGLMSALGDEYGDIAHVLEFDHAKGNFTSAARHGLMAQLTWIGGQNYKASELILDHLLPLARQGLAARNIDAGDADRYLGVVEERVRSGQTGAQWALRSLASMNGHGGQGKEGRFRTLAKATLALQKQGQPVHTWPLAVAQPSAADDWRDSYRYVGQIMTRDLFTVRPGDLVDLAASVMTWEHIRHVPVEDDEGHLVGLVSHRDLLKLVGRGTAPSPMAVERIMKRDVLTVSPKTSTLEALRLMRDARVGCVPVVEDGRLVGLVTETDLLTVAAAIMEHELSRPSDA